MEIEKRLKTVKNAIDWLEKRAIADRNLVSPNQQVIYLTHEQLILENMKSIQNPVFDEETFTQKNLKAKNQSIDYNVPTFFDSYEKELKKYEDNKSEREKNRSKRIRANQLHYFQPAQKAMNLNLEAIHLANQDQEEAIDKFIEACHAFPDVQNDYYDIFEIGNPSIYSIWYNLGLCLFNHGYFEEGLKYISEYYVASNEGDYYRDWFEEKLNIKESYNNRKRTITIDYEGIHFIRDVKGFHHNISEDTTVTLLDLPYKQPISLNFEYRDKDKPKLLDYFYLNQILPSEDSITCYEVILPLNKMPIFLSEFFPSILDDPSIQYRFAKDPEELKNNLRVAESHERTRKYYDEPQMEDEYFSSVVFLYIPEPLKESFYEEFRQFVKRYVVNERTDNERDEIILEELKADRERYEEWYRQKLLKEFQYEQEHHKEVAKIYADLKVLEQNILKNQPELFVIPVDEFHLDSQKAYLKLLDGVFGYKEIVQETARETAGLETMFFHSEKLKSSIMSKWENMIQLLDVDSYAALGKIRNVLEEILIKVFEQNGYSIFGAKGYKLTPTLMAKELYKNNTIAEDVKDDIIELHTVSKACSHFGVQNYQFWMPQQQSQSEAENKLKLLYQTIVRLVQIYGL